MAGDKNLNQTAPFESNQGLGNEVELGDVENYRSDTSQMFNHQLLVIYFPDANHQAGFQSFWSLLPDFGTVN